MGLLDKAKFWKKDDDALGDMSDLGDFGLEENPGAGGDPGGTADDLGLGQDFRAQPSGQAMPGTEAHQMPGSAQQAPEEAGGSIDSPSSFAQQAQQGASGAGPQQPQPTPYHEVPSPAAQAPAHQGAGGEMAKDIEIIHAKLDAIRSSLDSINQRLATLERIASGDNKSRYSW